MTFFFTIYIFLILNGLKQLFEIGYANTSVLAFG